MKKFLTQCVNSFKQHDKWLQPIVYHWHTFIAYIFLVGWSSVLQNFANRGFVIFLHAYIAASIMHWSRSKVIKALIYLLMFTLFLINASLEVNFDLNISPSMLTVLAETTQKESAEFINSLWSIPTIWIVPTLSLLVALFLLWAERHKSHIAECLKRSKFYCYIHLVSALMLLSGILSSWCYVTLFQCKTPDDVSAWNTHMRYPSDALTRTIIAFYDTHLSKKEIEEAILVAENAQSAIYEGAPEDSLNIVLVIGESYIKSHSSLYGYRLNTNPFMMQEQKKGRLFLFDDVVAPYNLTTNVMRNLISCNSLSDGQRWNDCPPLTAVFKKAGYRVAMYDNQKTFSLAATFTFALNIYLYAPRMAKACYDELNDTTFAYDAQMLEYYKEAICKPQKLSLTIFHLMGQHSTFSMRYPPEFEHFTADSIKRNEKWMTDSKRELIAQYDNATLYNDYVLKQIISYFSAKNTVLVYLADHGEEVYDYRNSTGRFGGDDLKRLLRYQYCVPFFVWCSDQYMQKNPQEAHILRQSVYRPFITDNTCQLLFHLGGLRYSSYYQSQHDILSPDYVCKQRILDDCYDYDLILSK